MNAKKILFTTDYSSLSDAALEFATMLTKEIGGQLLIAHVEEDAATYAVGEMYYGPAEPAADELFSLLYAVKPHDLTVPYEHRMLQGKVAETVVELAEEENVDLIVLGSHGRTGLGRLLMGSVAEEIVRKAHCPVLVYKQPAKKEATNKAVKDVNASFA